MSDAKIKELEKKIKYLKYENGRLISIVNNKILRIEELEKQLDITGNIVSEKDL